MNWFKKSLNNQLISVVVGVLLVLAVVVQVAMSNLHSGLSEYHQEITVSQDDRHMIDQINLDFRTQIQEWKNVLIRGKDETDRNKYWQRFLAMEETVKSDVEELYDHTHDKKIKVEAKGFLKIHSAMSKNYHDGYRAFIESGYQAAFGDQSVRGIDREVTELLKEMSRLAVEDVERLSEESEEHASSIEMTATIIYLVALFIAVVTLYIFLNKSIINPISLLLESIKSLQGGNFNNQFQSSLSNEIGDLFSSLGEMQESLKQSIESERVSNAENLRVKQALDSVTANVMIADPDFNLIYLNEAVLSMMRNAERDIRTDLPGFDANKLMGANIDVFHKNPAHQRHMVGALTSTYNGEIIVGGRTFSLTANPIIVDGERLGTVVEWLDRTAEVSIEKEIDVVIDAAGRGDLTKQIVLDDKDGFFKNLSGGINTLVSTVEVALNDTLRMLGAMSRGDLTERITREYQGSFGQLKDDANTTADKLTEVIGSVRSSSGAITSAANEIAQGNADLSQRTEEQASSLEETASSMEEMTSVVKQSADNAESANGLASEAQVKASRGGEVVSQAVGAMDEINTASKKISDIIGVIDEIAFQTNLLALNAAVEAARAGEQGRGFAVVAGEVRNLAQRSAGAAKEIKDLIRDSVSKVDDGTRLVNESGETLTEIVEAVEKVSAMIRDISAAAREQTSGIEQVNVAITQMDEMTQQNAALVEEASAAGEAMADQARNMNTMMEFFTVDEGGVHKPALHVVHQPSATRAPVAAPKAASKSNSSDDEWEDF